MGIDPADGESMRSWLVHELGHGVTYVESEGWEWGSSRVSLDGWTLEQGVSLVEVCGDVDPKVAAGCPDLPPGSCTVSRSEDAVTYDLEGDPLFESTRVARTAAGIAIPGSHGI